MVFGDSGFVVVVCLFGWFWVKICVYVCLLRCWLDVVGNLLLPRVGFCVGCMSGACACYYLLLVACGLCLVVVLF